MASYYDEEAGLLGGGSKGDYSYEFAERQIRQGFVRKVLGLLSFQLLFTAGISALFMFQHSVKHYMLSNAWPFFTAFGLSFALIIAMGCSETLRRHHPYNILTLMAFTACEAVLVGTVCATYDAPVVLLAVGITAAVVVGCVLFTLQTKVDLTMSSGALVGAAFALMTGLLLNMIFHLKWFYVAICIVGVILFTLYLVFDLQLVMGGHKYALTPDEHVFAALNLYLDIINIFLYILQLVSSNDR